MTRSVEDWIAHLAPDAATSRAVEADGEDSRSAKGPVSQSLLLTVSRSAMACEFEVLLNQQQYPQAPQRSMEALQLIGELEDMLSVYKPRSELSNLNRFGTQRRVLLPYDAFTMLELAVDAHRWTAGAFDVTAGSLSETWGFSRRKGRMPDEQEIADALSRVGSQHLELDVATKTAGLARPGISVNPGGIGKGYALDRAAQKLVSTEISDFMMHGGMSSVVARGDRRHPETGGGWLVSLKHPWRWEEHLGMIRLRDAALATSGSGKQFFHFGGQRYSHIIDPRSGRPAQGVMSVTVICPSAAIADILATAFFVMGPEETEQFCSEYPQISAIMVLLDPKNGKQSIALFNAPAEIWSPR